MRLMFGSSGRSARKAPGLALHNRLAVGHNRLAVGVGILAVLSLASTASLSAQSRSIFVVSGYGTVTYEAVATDAFPNDFSASVAPVILYSMGGDILFETELEFGLSGAETTTTLEYAQIDYLGFERVQVIAGKFLLPFGVFGERIHPSWINKLPTGPVVYGHAHGGVAESGLLPVLSDAGVMIRYSQPLRGSRIVFSGWVSQGPRQAVEEADDHDEEGAASLEGPAFVGGGGAVEDTPAPPVSFGTAFSDNNRNKMVGARLGLVNGPAFEVYVSGFHARYDAGNELAYKGGAVSAEWRGSGFELRAEGVATSQQYDADDVIATLNRSGVYAQVSRRIDDFEPVVRWGRLADGTVDGATRIDGHNEVAVGLTFWVEPTVPLKFAWEFHQNRDDRLYVQWAYGF